MLLNSTTSKNGMGIMQEQQLLSVFMLPIAFIRKDKEQNTALEKKKKKKSSSYTSLQKAFLNK